MRNTDRGGLKSRDFKKLLKTPEQELIGEIIRLNHTIYENTLDVLKVCSAIKMKRQKVA